MILLLLSSMALAAAPVSPAGCVLAKDGDAARALMKAAPGSAQVQPALDRARPALTACGAATSGPALDRLLADMAEQVLRTDYAGYPFGKLPAATFTDAKAEGLRRETADWPVADAVGRCVVARDVQAAVRLVRTRADSGGERSAMEQVMPLIPGCLDAGAAFNTSRTELRAGIARALYRDVLSLIPDLWPA